VPCWGWPTLLVLSACSSVYLLIGVAYNLKHPKGSGIMEPMHTQLWLQLPGLIVDGVREWRAGVLTLAGRRGYAAVAAPEEPAAVADGD